jgi:hypothetical protein
MKSLLSFTSSLSIRLQTDLQDTFCLLVKYLILPLDQADLIPESKTNYNLLSQVQTSFPNLASEHIFIFSIAMAF